MGVHIAEIEALEEEFGKTVHPAKLFVFGEEETIKALDQELRDTFQNEAEVFMSGKAMLTLCQRGK